MTLAPIVLFVYNRPEHTKQTVEALQKNTLASKSELFIYSDAPKQSDTQENVDKVREYIKHINGFKNVTIIERDHNWGLAKSIIDGVTSIVNKYGKIIVLEDDLVTNENFLKYMNDSLEKYKDEQNVYSVTGYSFSNAIEKIDSTYFLKLTSSWSWGTWQDKWKNFSHSPVILKSCLKNKYRFNYDNSYNYTGMVNLQLKDKIDSWAIYWYASIYLKKGLTLFPAKSMVRNIGFDGSGIHCSNLDTIKQTERFKAVEYILTDDIYEKQSSRKQIILSLKQQHSLFPIISKIQNYIKSILNL